MFYLSATKIHGSSNVLALYLVRKQCLTNLHDLAQLTCLRMFIDKPSSKHIFCWSLLTDHVLDKITYQVVVVVVAVLMYVCSVLFQICSVHIL